MKLPEKSPTCLKWPGAKDNLPGIAGSKTNLPEIAGEKASDFVNLKFLDTIPGQTYDIIPVAFDVIHVFPECSLDGIAAGFVIWFPVLTYAWSSSSL